MLRSVGSHDCKALLSPVRWSGVDTCQLKGSPETHAAVPAANVIVELYRPTICSEHVKKNLHYVCIMYVYKSMRAQI